MTNKLNTFLAMMLAALGLVGCVRSSSPSGLSTAFFSDMIYLQPDSRSARASSWNRTGRNRDFKSIRPGGTLVLAELEGAGCIRHIYFTIGGPKHYMRDLVLRMYWDGKTDPSVEVPFGDFFGLGHERVRFYRSLLFTVNEGGNGISGTYGFNCYFIMPFARGARLILTNEGEQPVGAVWYHIDYEQFDRLEDGVGRFHAQWRCESPTTAVTDENGEMIHNGVNLDGAENFVILEAEGCGNLVGYFLNVDNLRGGWYGEGDDMIFIDGEEWPPSFHGTGSEEIFGGGACPNRAYAGPFTGFHLVGNPGFAGKTSMYRFFVTDLIRFRKSIRVTIEHGHANNLANDYTTTAFWYQTEPHAPFPPLPPAAERYARVGDDPYDVAYEKLQELKRKMNALVAAAREGRAQMSGEEIADLFLDQSVRLPRKLDDRKYDVVVESCERWFARIDDLIAAGANDETL